MGGAAASLQSPNIVNVGVFSAGVSSAPPGVCNSAGTTGTVSNQLIFCGGSNVTLSESINGQSATISIIGNTRGVSGISAGSQLATSGTVLFQNSNSISFGMSNSSIITGSYELMSHNSVYHTGIIGAESQVSFDPIAGHHHDGIDSRLVIIPQYIEVAISGKQFSSVKAAIDSIVDASATKPYVVRIYPGIYTESPFSMKQYVTIEGSEYFSTTIQTNDNTNHFITGAARSTIRNVTITGPTGVGNAAIYYTDQVPATTAPFVLQDILIRKGYYGVWNAASVSTSVIHLINVNNWYNGVAMNTFARATGFGVIVAQASGFMCGASDSIVKGFEADGANSELYLYQCYFRNTPFATSITGLYVDNGGYVLLSACTFSRGTNAIWIGPNGTGGTIYAAACIIRNNATYFFNTDILIQNAAAIMHYNGIASRTKLNIAAGATFNGNFTDVTSGVESTVNLGEFYIGDLLNQLPLRDYGYTTYLTGQKTGGEVTTTGGLGVHIANGAGFVNTSPTPDAVKAIAWVDTDINITANTREWIYVDSNGAVQSSAIEPDENTNIMLAVAYASAADVVFLDEHVRHLQHFIGNLDEYTETAIGPIYVHLPGIPSGLDVTENLINPLRLDVTNGNYYVTSELHTVVGASPITFTYWYGSDAGGWTTVTGQTDIDVVNYDNTGVLTAMGAGKWKKDVLYVNVNDNVITTQYHVVYGQTQYDTQADAENAPIPVPPSFLASFALELAGIVVQKNAANINKILDTKPTGHYHAPGHNTLPGLQGGNSTGYGQYFHLNSTEYTGLSQKIVAISGSNAVTSGSTITFGNLNDLSFYVTNGSVVGSFSQSIQPAVQSLNGSSGIMSISGSQNITAQNNNSTISIYGPASILSSLGVSGNVTETGSTGITGGVFVLAGGDNITLSQSNNTISIFGLSQSNQPRVISLNATSGQLTLSGSQNITVANNAATISVYGPASILSSLGVSGNVTETGSTGITGGPFVLAGANNISLSQSNNTISIYGVASQSVQPGIQSISAGTTRITTGEAIFSNSNNISFGVDGQTITATVHAQQTGISSVIASNITFTSGSVQLTGAGIVTVSANATNNPITISASQAAITGIAGSAASTVTTGLVQFANANNISFGLNGSTMTASYSQSSEPRVISLNGTTGELSLSGASNITVSALNGSTITIYGPASILSSLGVSGNVTETGSTGITGGPFVLAGANNISLSQSNNTISIYGAGAGTGAAINAIQAGSRTGTTGTIVFSNSNNVTFGMDTNDSVITASASFAATGTGIAALAANATSFTSGTVVFSDFNNISFGTSGTGTQQTVTATASYSQSTGPSGLYATNIATTFTSGNIAFSGSNNITVSTAVQAIIISGPNTHAQQTGISGIAGSAASTVTNGTVQFANANNISFGLNGSTMTGSVHAQQTGISGIAGSAASTVTNGTVQFANSNNISFGLNGSTMTASYSQSAQTGISSIAASNTTYTSGQVEFTGSNMITVKSSANQRVVIDATQSVQPGITGIAGSAASTVTTGLVQFANSNNVSFGLNSNTMTASINLQTGISSIIASNITFTSGSVQFTGAGAVTVSANATTNPITINAPVQSIQTQNLHGLALYNNTSGNTTIGTSGTVSLAATNMTITADTANNSIIGFSVNTHAVQTGISSIIASNITFTQGSVQFTGAGIATISANATTNPITISVSQTVQTQNLHALALYNNTSGNTTIGTSGTVSFAGTNITISANTANNSIIGFSVAAPVGAGIAALSAGTTQATSGTISFQDGSNVSFGINGQTLTASVANPGILSIFASTTRITSGEAVFGNANNITFGVNGQTVTASFSQTVQTQSNIQAIYLVGNTTGTTGSISTGTVAFAGGNSITLSQSSGTNSTIITISGPQFSNSNNVSFGANAGTITATVTLPSVGQLNGSSGTLTISAGNLISISNNASTINVINVLSSSATAADVTSVSNAGTLSSRFALADHAHRGIGVIYASGANGANSFYGPMTIATGNTNLTFSTGASVLSFYGPSPGAGAGIAAIGNTASSNAFTSGSVIFSDQANITINTSVNGASQYIRISAPSPSGAAVVKIFEPHKGIALAARQMSVGDMRFQPFWIPFNMTATKADIIMYITNSSSAAGTVRINIGLYTYTQSTANTLSTASITFAYNSTLGAGGSYTNISGTRYRSISLANWAFTPGDYLLAIQNSVTTGLTSGTYSMYGKSSLSILGEDTLVGNILNWGIDGNGSFGSSLLPATLHISDINRTGSGPNIQPWIVFQGTQ